MALRRKVAHFLVAVSLIVSIGGHWAILQSVAWVGMIATYSRDATILVALEKTFDGQHPCQICRSVQKGKLAEKKNQVIKVETKLELWAVSGPAGLTPPPPLATHPAWQIRSELRFESPPIPPPRLA